MNEIPINPTRERERKTFRVPLYHSYADTFERLYLEGFNTIRYDGRDWFVDAVYRTVNDPFLTVEVREVQGNVESRNMRDHILEQMEVTE